MDLIPIWIVRFSLLIINKVNDSRVLCGKGTERNLISKTIKICRQESYNISRLNPDFSFHKCHIYSSFKSETEQHGLLLLLLLLLSHFSHVRLCVTPQTAAHQAPLSLGFFRQEYWSGLPSPSPMHESEKWKWSRSVVSNSLRPMDYIPPGSSVHGIFPGKSTGVGCHFLLQCMKVKSESEVAQSWSTLYDKTNFSETMIALNTVDAG